MMGWAMVHFWVKSPRKHTEIARVSPVETTESGSFILYKTYLNPHVTEYVNLYMSYPSSHVHKKFIILFWVLIEFRLVVGKECGRWGSLVALPSDQGRWDSLMALGTRHYVVNFAMHGQSLWHSHYCSKSFTQAWAYRGKGKINESWVVHVSLPFGWHQLFFLFSFSFINFLFFYFFGVWWMNIYIPSII